MYCNMGKSRMHYFSNLLFFRPMFAYTRHLGVLPTVCDGNSRRVRTISCAPFKKKGTQIVCRPTWHSHQDDIFILLYLTWSVLSTCAWLWHLFLFFPPSSYIPVSLSFSSLLFFLLPNYHVVSLDSIPIPARQKKSTGCHINDFIYKWRSESRFIFFFSQDETVANWTGCVIVQRITQLDGWQGRKLIQAITYIMATSRGFQSSTSTAGKDGRRLIHQDSLYVSAIPFSWA